MLKVSQYDYIRTAHRVYGKKIREISRETGHSKNTVKKILRGEYTAYKKREKQPYPVLGPYIKIIDKWLEEDKGRDKKQRHTDERQLKHFSTTIKIPVFLTKELNCPGQLIRKEDLDGHRQTSEETVYRALHSLCENMGIRAAARVFEVKPDTIRGFSDLKAENFFGEQRRKEGLIFGLKR